MFRLTPIVIIIIRFVVICYYDTCSDAPRLIKLILIFRFFITDIYLPILITNLILYIQAIFGLESMKIMKLFVCLLFRRLEISKVFIFTSPREKACLQELHTLYPVTGRKDQIGGFFLKYLLFFMC